MKLGNITKVSQWIALGAFGSGFYLLENKEKETEKAMSFSCKKFNSSGNLVPATVWFPKKFVQAVQNDFYTAGAEEMYLIPEWIYSAKVAEGYEI